MSVVFLASQQSRDAVSIVTRATAEISGAVVTDDAAAMAVRRATITLTGDVAMIHLIAATDDAGRFSFTSLPAGRYSLSASRGAYLSTAYGSKRPGGPGTAIVIGDDQHVVGITIRMLRGSVLSGMVLDESGEPASHVIVSALKSGMSLLNGERVPQIHSTQVTDARGMYRIYGLAPGQYLVSVSPSIRSNQNPRDAVDVHQITDEEVQWAQQLLRGSAVAPITQAMPGGGVRRGAEISMVNYAPVYYPAVSAIADATTIALGPQEERSGIDLQLRLVPTARVEGVTVGPDGGPMPNVEVTIMDPAPESSGTFDKVLRSARSDQQGRFVLPSISPGRYQVFAIARPLSGMSEVSVDGRDVTTSITLGPGVTMSGRVVFDGASPRPPDPTTLLPLVQMVSESPALFGLSRQANDDGTFSYTLAPGMYRIFGLGNRPWRSLSASGWHVKSVTANGTDITDVAFEIKPNENISGVVVTLTDQGTEIAGILQDAAGKPAPDLFLIVFPADKRFWIPLSRRIQQVRPGADGRFIVQGLPTGDYLISALSDVDEGEWNDPAFLAALASRAPIKITLAEGDKKIQDIRVGGG